MTATYYEERPIKWEGEGVYVCDHSKGEWRKVSNFNDASYQLRVGYKLEWVEADDVYEDDEDDETGWEIAAPDAEGWH